MQRDAADSGRSGDHDHHRDLPLGTVDASVVAASERLKTTTVATTDRRDFTVVRPDHCDHLDILP